MALRQLAVLMFGVAAGCNPTSNSALDADDPGTVMVKVRVSDASGASHRALRLGLRGLFLADAPFALAGLPGEVALPHTKTQVELRVEEKAASGDTWSVIATLATRLEADVAIGLGDSRGPTTAPLRSIDAIKAHVQAKGVKKVSDLLGALPQELRWSYVLMETSASRHRADAAHPRLIMFGPDARLLAATSSQPADPLREVLELAELSDDGRWRFTALDLTSGTPQWSDDAACKPCHGPTPRPIWGNYPKWPGAIGDEGGRLQPPQEAAVAALATATDTKDRFSTLEFEMQPGRFYLPHRRYYFANTAFNMELGPAAADGLYRRAKASAQWRTLRDKVVFGFECRYVEDAEPAVKTLREALPERFAMWKELGLEPVDFALHKRAFESLVDGDERWNESGADLDEFVMYLAFHELYQEDAAVRAQFSAIAADIAHVHRIFWELKWEQRVAAAEQDDQLYRDFRPSQYFLAKVLGDDAGRVTDTPYGRTTAGRAAFCNGLATKIGAP